MDWLQSQARSQGVWLVAGTLPIRNDGKGTDEGKLWSRSYVIDAQGEIRAKYDKVHLFDVDVPPRRSAQSATAESYRESDQFLHGTELVLVDTPAGRLGMAICFDLRFPELFRRLTEQGAEWICLPSAFTRCTGRCACQRAQNLRSQHGRRSLGNRACQCQNPGRLLRHGGNRRRGPGAHPPAISGT
ncbi:MAG: hypothetical protein B7X29_06425 [Halothiobacillus sp. 13-55-115]|nr:MAG: hypothetical protein B7X29_06425 [Halothiobacillus sp. 13-55-115]